MPVPRGKIDAEKQTELFAAFGKLFNNIAFSVFIRAVFDAVLGIGTRKKAKAVVVLCGEDDAAAAGFFDNPCPLVGINAFNIELLRLFLSGTPFVSGAGVHSEVNKGVVFIVRKPFLKLCWSHRIKPPHKLIVERGAAVAFVPGGKSLFRTTERKNNIAKRGKKVFYFRH